MFRPIAAIASVVVVSAPALAGPDWVENIDAGSSLLTAQAVVGIGTPQRISGTLSTGFTGDFEDIYIIRIDQPTSFSFSMENAILSGNTRRKKSCPFYKIRIQLRLMS